MQHELKEELFEFEKMHGKHSRSSTSVLSQITNHLDNQKKIIKLDFNFM